MNHDNDHLPCFDDLAEEREWLAQERAMRQHRLHPGMAGDDPNDKRYRLMSRALQTPPPIGLPANFAAQVSATIALRAPRMGFERGLTITLVGILVLAAAIVTFVYGAAWWPSFKMLLPAPAAAHWWGVLSGCIGLSWLLDAWYPQAMTPRR